MHYITPRNVAIGAATICLFSGLIGGAASDDCTAGLVIAAVSLVALAAILALTKRKSENDEIQMQEYDVKAQSFHTHYTTPKENCLSHVFKSEPIETDSV